MLQSPKINQIAIDTATDLVYNSSMKNNNTSTKRENRMITTEECKQAINTLWRMWDRTDNRTIRKNILASIEKLDSTINELENKCQKVQK